MTEIAVHPEFAEHGSFGHLRLGRIKPTDDQKPKLLLEPYVAASFVPPEVIDNYSAVASWPMYGNDRLGDCTWATVGHIVQALTTKAGTERTPVDADIEQGYWETGDPPAATGNPGDPTDNGRMETQVLAYWRHTGIPNETDKIVAYASVNHTQIPRVKETVALLGAAYIGIEMPLTAESQQVWDYVPDDPNNQPGSWGGHAVPIVGYDGEFFYVVTWGAIMKMTVAFYENYVDEVYAVVSPDAAAAYAVPGAALDIDSLQTDLATLTAGQPLDPGDATGGDLPTDTPPATAAPDPTPQPASEPGDAPPTYVWNVSAAPLQVTTTLNDPVAAKTLYLRLITDNEAALITATPVSEESA